MKCLSSNLPFPTFELNNNNNNKRPYIHKVNNLTLVYYDLCQLQKELQGYVCQPYY